MRTRQFCSLYFLSPLEPVSYRLYYIATHIRMAFETFSFLMSIPWLLASFNRDCGAQLGTFALRIGARYDTQDKSLCLVFLGDLARGCSLSRVNRPLLLTG